MTQRLHRDYTEITLEYKKNLINKDRGWYGGGDPGVCQGSPGGHLRRLQQ